MYGKGYFTLVYYGFSPNITVNTCKNYGKLSKRMIFNSSYNDLTTKITIKQVTTQEPW